MYKNISSSHNKFNRGFFFNRNWVSYNKVTTSKYLAFKAIWPQLFWTEVFLMDDWKKCTFIIQINILNRMNMINVIGVLWNIKWLNIFRWLMTDSQKEKINKKCIIQKSLIKRFFFLFRNMIIELSLLENMLGKN